MGKRLLLRLGTTCNNGCVHCTLRDVRELALPERSVADALHWLSWGRAQGCDEVVFLRGEVTLRSDLGPLCLAARRFGYGLVQIQGNGRRFGDPTYAAWIARHGCTDAEIDFYGPNAHVHDEIAQVLGAFDQTVSGWRWLRHVAVNIRVNIPILANNLDYLSEMVRYLFSQGVVDVQLSFVRPVLGGEFRVLTTLNNARNAIVEALTQGLALGLRLTTEAIPFCVLGPYSRLASDVIGQGSDASMVVVDLHRGGTSVEQLRALYRSTPSVCEPCKWVDSCPKTWGAYLERHGTSELVPENVSSERLINDTPDKVG